MGELRALSVLGEAQHLAGAPDAAVLLFRECIAGASEVALPLLTLCAWRDLGRSYATLGQPAEALSCYQESLLRFDEVDQPDAKAQTLLYLAHLHFEEGRIEEALRDASRAQALRAGPATQLEIAELLAHLYEDQGDYKTALLHARNHLRLKEHIHGQEQATRLKNVQIRRATEQAEHAAEVHRLRYVELAQSHVQLVQAERMQAAERLVAGLLHEINTPLGVINASMDTIQRAFAKTQSLPGRDPLPTPIATAMQTANASAREATERIGHLVGQLREFVRLDQADQALTNLNELLRATLRLLEPQIPDRVRVQPHLEPIPSILCYPKELNQVFLTLLAHAADAIEDLGTITIRSTDVNKTIRMEIKHTGKSLPPEEQAGLFDLGFAERDATVRLDVGMAMCRNIIHRHRGQISLRSTDEGTCLEIELPHQ